jgi:hypothetical protein
MRAPLVLAYAIGEEPVGAVAFVAGVDPVEGAAGAAVVAATSQLYEAVGFVKSNPAPASR